ncbi:TIGR04076 family protein [Pseudoflavonifractor sp. 60]|uniref:TIGR04076 family protein n=1 Tax=Pseudoflavonifractor sp. 60 TaxID=2304576 RepID=UPI001368521D|nr:TIGR04076 family protein [Pseudoflavonifractor sp. 60]NBI67913.1 TIGR04076 family protein [Pseudoflavonifractor sp. 60]
MRKVKITILRTTFIEDLAKEYSVEGFGPCSMMKEGQVFYTEFAKPEGFCDEAWKAIYQYVFALAHGGGNDGFYNGCWIKTPGVAICSCNDGLRPVIMKLEALEDN